MKSAAQGHGYALTTYVATDGGATFGMYRLSCRECGEPFQDDETPVPSRSIRGKPLVHEECA